MSVCLCACLTAWASLPVDQSDYGWNNSQENHTQQSQPERPKYTVPLTWEGLEQTGFGNRNVLGQLLLYENS